MQASSGGEKKKCEFLSLVPTPPSSGMCLIKKSASNGHLQRDKNLRVDDMSLSEVVPPSHPSSSHSFCSRQTHDM